MSDDAIASQPTSNYGSRLGEAIGRIVEHKVNRIMQAAMDEVGGGYTYVTHGGPSVKKGRYKKLLIADTQGIRYNIDAAIKNGRGNWVALIESKYIRYGKHNRDKGSWIAAHAKLRRTYPTIRLSLVILVGTWSTSSRAMMENFGATIFYVPMSAVTNVFAEYGVDLRWGEKERDKVEIALSAFHQLDEAQWREIGRKLLAEIGAPLRDTVLADLRNDTPREVQEVEVIITSNLGEMRVYRFDSIQAAINSLSELDSTAIFAEDESTS